MEKKHVTWCRCSLVFSKAKFWGRQPWKSRDCWRQHFFAKKYFFKKCMQIIYHSTQVNADKSLQYNYGLKKFGSKDRRTLMTLGKLIFLDISFSTYSKHQMVMLKGLFESCFKKIFFTCDEFLTLFAYPYPFLISLPLSFPFPYSLLCLLTIWFLLQWVIIWSYVDSFFMYHL